MNKYLAKSNPRESIISHTEKLIDNYKIYKKIYPNLNVDWDILYLACIYHDLGKMNRKFQDKIEGIKRHKDEIPHGILSLSFIDTKELEKQGYEKDEIKLLAHSIAYHHEREFNFDKETWKNEIELLKEEALGFKYERLGNLNVKNLSKKYFAMDRIYEDKEDREETELFFRYVMVKGLLNRIDYAASGGIDVEKENSFLLNNINENLLEKFKKKDPNAGWNDLQNYMINNRDKNLIIVAQTGMGKTEAGLLWIGDSKGFFTLPLKTAINAMYKRIVENIIINDYENKVGLLHSDMRREYLEQKEEIDFDEYYNKTKQLSLPLTICTLDQIFDFVYRYRGFEQKLATLSYSKVVIDEVQMYSPDLLAYLIVGLSYIDKVGGKFAVLTATLPQVFVDLLSEENVNFLKPKPFTNSRIRHSLKVINENINADFVKSIYKNNKVLVICNTVNEAQRIYKDLLQDKDIGNNIKLFHSGFIKLDRKKKEDEILRFGSKESERKGIWITTQVVEASLDIDFDILVTELSDLNGLFQRLGRCYRDRDWEKEGYNSYVFDGGDSKCSGVGSVIDRCIYELSKKALKDIDGVITENQKINLINNIYTKEKLIDTQYYNDIIRAIDYLKLINPFEKSAMEVKALFRNIESKTVIPKPIYDTHRSKIDSYISILQREYDKDISLEEREIIKKQKLRARINLDDYTVSIPLYRAEKHLINYKKINNYEFLEIFECDYTDEMGIVYKPKDNIDKKISKIADKMF